MNALLYVNRARTVEENVQRSCVLEDPPIPQQLATKLQRQLAGCHPLPGRPLPWIGWKKYAGMFEHKRVRLVSRNHFAGDEVAVTVEGLGTLTNPVAD